MRKSLFSAIILATGLGLVSPQAQSSVYISADNQDLRNSLNVLVDAGLINTPLQQLPMPWRAILLELDTIDTQQLNDTQQLALLQLRHYLRNAQSGPQTYVKLQASSEAPWVNRFGRSVQERGSLSVARHFKGERFAARLQINHRWDPYEDDNEQTLDGSYLAYNFGDVSLSLDAQPLWWGPAQHSSLLMSTNARPLTKLRLDYSPDFAPIGLNPLHVSTFVGYNETRLGNINVSREVLGLRAATQLQWGLQAGLSALHQSSVHQTSTTDINSEIPDNTMVSLDLRKGWHWQQHHFAAYAEVGFDGQLEEGENPAFTVGGEWQFNASIFSDQQMRHTLVAEYTDTESRNFYQRLPRVSTQPFYQHYQRNLGSSFAPDSRTLSLSYRLFAADGSGWTAQLAYSSLADDSNQTQALLQRSQPVFGGLLNIGFEYNDNERAGANTDDIGARISWEWRF